MENRVKQIQKQSARATFGGVKSIKWLPEGKESERRGLPRRASYWWGEVVPFGGGALLLYANFGR